MNWYIRALALFFITLFTIASTYAAGPHDAFEVILGKQTAKVGEALDLTINAVDKNGEIITDYLWDILVFSESDNAASFPNDLKENSYKFTAANEGSVKFENAVKFSKAGKQDLYVYDLKNENILGIGQVDITKADVASNIDIEILSPENGVTLWKNNIKVSGSTKKNHQVKIILNGNQELKTTSNSDGVFEKELENMQQWENTLKAQVLNADDEVIGESKVVSLKINSSAPEFKRINITPTGEVEAESEIEIEVISNAGLSEVKVIINDIITSLTEAKNGIYKGKTNAPSEAGEYPVDVVLKNEFAIETNEKAVETLKVSPKPELNAGGEEEPKKVVEEIKKPEMNSTPETVDLSIKNIKVTELKTKSILTWDAVKAAESYNIYKKIDENKIELIENITDPKYEIEITGDEIRYEDFAIKALGKTSSGEIIQWDLSEMTRVKTGPELYIILALIAILMSSGIFFLRKRA